MLDSITDSQSGTDPESGLLRRQRLLARTGVLVLWLLGVLLAVSSGWDPGPWWPRSGQAWPYPLGHVLIEIAKITLVSLAVYDLLRPRLESSLWAPTARAVGALFVTLLTTPMWTDQPGYAYATTTYILMATALLFLLLVFQLLHAAFHRRKHAA
jgi:hypothetical protein